MRDKTMKNVCVITGGGSGMGLSTAKLMGKSHYVIICGRSVDKLERAIYELKSIGIACEASPCDIGDRTSVEDLAQHANETGRVQAVIHAAGLSPHMGDSKTILQANILGTIYINTEFSRVMGENSCIIDLSSMSAHLTPEIIMPKGLYKYALINPDKFMKKMITRVNLFPKKVRSGVAYAMSKHFDIWYAKKCAGLYGDKGIRVISVSPGNFDTPMGKLEEEEAGTFMKKAAIKRFGYPEEIAYLLASCADERNGYLTGVDIICDGGLVASGANVLRK
jgi:NAD(P)-dependent dehydrogenase (short-subunit alcohol dehydrogenase family)